MKIILGSSSLWRRKILERAGYTFTTIEANIDERLIRHPDPEQLPILIACAKAEALLPTFQNEPALLITADEIVWCQGRVFEKPRSREEAKMFLKSYQTSSASTYTALVLTHTQTRQRVSGVERAVIHFNPISDEAIEQMLEDPKTYTFAGAFQAEYDETRLNQHVRCIEGTLDSVKGMPLNLLKKLLAISQ